MRTPPRARHRARRRVHGAQMQFVRDTAVHLSIGVTSQDMSGVLVGSRTRKRGI